MELKRIIKRKLAHWLTHESLGKIIRKTYSNKVPNKFGIVVDTDNENISDRAVASIFFGIYESAELRLLAEYLDQGLDIVELGGSIGVVSSFIAKKLNKSSNFIIVEANKALIPSIRKNINLNCNFSRYEIINALVSYTSTNKDGKGLFQHTKENTGGKKLVASSNNDETQTISVKALGLSSILKKYDINDYILISDIEGVEHEILAHDAKSLKNCKYMFIEIHDMSDHDENWSIKNLIKEIEKLNFVMKASDGSAVFLFKKRSEQ